MCMCMHVSVCMCVLTSINIYNIYIYIYICVCVCVPQKDELLLQEVMLKQQAQDKREFNLEHEYERMMVDIDHGNWEQVLHGKFVPLPHAFHTKFPLRCYTVL